MLGQEVKDWSIIKKIFENRLDVIELSASIYIVKIETTEGKNYSKKIIID
jgi:hypothetical protein